jgi:glycosyltransferase involved in cell wall biosynthesis
VNRVVVEQIDLEDVRPGGIETCIVDMLTWSSSTRFHVFDEFGLIARLLLRGHPLVQFIHTDGLAQTSRKSDSLWRRFAPLYRLLESRVHPHARQVVIFNRPDGERLRAKLGHVLLKRTWFDPSVYRPGESFTVDECPAPDAALQLLWVGRFEEQKNPVLAVQTLAALRKMGMPANLTMVGSDTKKAEILANATQLQVHDHLDLTGAPARKDVADRIRRADLLLMTSYFEGSPRVLIEANACGLPAAVTPGSVPTSRS